MDLGYQLWEAAQPLVAGTCGMLLGWGIAYLGQEKRYKRMLDNTDSMVKKLTVHVPNLCPREVEQHEYLKKVLEL